MAHGRSWTPRMAYSSKYKGAFLYGEGIHGWIDPDTKRYMDDLWFYDLPGNKWHCVWPGTPIDNRTTKLNKEGVEIIMWRRKACK